MKGKRGDRPDTAEQKPNDDAEPDAAPIAPAPAEPKPDADKPAAGAAVPALSTIGYQPERIVKETIRHKYTINELAELADKMAQAAAQVYAIERQKSEQAAHYGAELKAANLVAGDLVQKYNLKYEMREVECRIVYDRPEPGYKAYIRTDNGESIREVPMTDAEKQRAFVFDAGDGKPQ
jgi:hypothetical protein